MPKEHLIIDIENGLSIVVDKELPIYEYDYYYHEQHNKLYLADYPSISEKLESETWWKVIATIGDKKLPAMAFKSGYLPTLDF